MNLTTEPWIPIVWDNGKPGLVSLREAFELGRQIRDGPQSQKCLAVEALPSGAFVSRFAGPSAPELTHRERLWPGPALRDMLCAIIKNKPRRDP